MKKQKKSHFAGLFRERGGSFEVERFDPAEYDAVIRSSICTGEKVAGFKNNRDGHFTEVLLIRSPKDIEEFKRTYGVDVLRTEY